MRGVISLSIRRRITTTSMRYTDKWAKVDTIKLINQPGNTFLVVSKYFSKKYVINRSELSFIRYMFTNYGPGDYNVLFFGKGKIRGMRRFADVIITDTKMFLRRREMSYMKDSASLTERDSSAMDTESYIGHFMRTKRPGIWYNI